ncbi:FAD-dependent 5-carboxymethylaminomethyl-2-thiouridine(34) oxidoreductase MnmC [Variovorax sp. CCNWLW235]|uniref:FAD-dependent 5-carboxymethylaminomethyl-2-thiouridine(34) oxidoreductase MnmC n=1 Tax=Variovorax sp. CCNWLW235 TaxID=3127463 RepID=UPI003076E67C
MAAEPVAWRADGVPYSERFGDIYHTEIGALAQARHVFLGGCGLPEAWSGRPKWLILETGFGLGLNFLTTWQVWRADANRPRMLHVVSIEAHPVGPEDLLRAAGAYPELLPLAEELAAQWHGLLPGFHRLAFEAGCVLLTLCIGDVQPMLRAQRFEADSIFLDGFSPEQNPDMWSPDALKAVSRFAHQGTGIAARTDARAVQDALSQNGFQLERRPGPPPTRDGLIGVFAPAWTVRRRGPAPEHVETPGHCAIIGAGLAGAAVAASLARRGWQVTVLDAADRPAAGASGLPVGVLAPHVSPDDALLSRLTRAGIRATWLELERLLEEGPDWRAASVLERRPEGDTRVPAGWSESGPNESWPASAAQLANAGLPADSPALWHARAGWVRPSRLIEAWLREPGIEFRGNAPVARLSRSAAGWQLWGAANQLLAEADRVVVAAGYESGRFAPTLPLQPVRGQVAWGRMAGDLALPATPLNGDGHLIAHVPEDEGALLWLCGATFDRDSTDLAPQVNDTEANKERLKRLHPGAAAALAPAFENGEAEHWVGIRCASGDRRPLVGPLGEAGLWACTALGSRGLSFAALCAELLAAQWHGEPLPLPVNLAKALGTERAAP